MSSPTRSRDHSGRRAGSWARVRTLSAALVLAFGALLFSPAAPAFAGESESIFSLVNQSRAAAGLGALNRNSAMDGVALAWANHLASTGQLAHNPSYSAQIPGGWSNAGENVAQGQPTGSTMHAAWMASPAHRANILGAYTDVGVAFISAGGTTWGVEVFAAYGSSAPLAQARNPPAQNAGSQVPPASRATSATQAKAAADAAALLAQQQAAELAAQQVAAQQLAAHAAVILADAAAERSAGEAELRRSTSRAVADEGAASLKPVTLASAAGGMGRVPAGIILATAALVALGGVHVSRVRARRGISLR